jgi:uncharacterized membrane protein
MIAVILAMIAGLTFSVNTLNIDYIIKKVGFPTYQINVDGNLTYGLVLLPLFIYEMYKPYPMYTFKDILYTNLSIFFVYCSTICFTFAMKYGKGGIVQAIDNLKIIVQTVLAIVFSGLIPTVQ